MNRYVMITKNRKMQPHFKFSSLQTKHQAKALLWGPGKSEFAHDTVIYKGQGWVSAEEQHSPPKRLKFFIMHVSISVMPSSITSFIFHLSSHRLFWKISEQLGNIGAMNKDWLYHPFFTVRVYHILGIETRIDKLCSLLLRRSKTGKYTNCWRNEVTNAQVTGINWAEKV